MTREEIKDELGIEDEIIFLDPAEEFDEGIMGVTEDKQHLIYGFNQTAASIAAAYRKYYEKEYFEKYGKEPDEKEIEDQDFMTQAFEWLEVNTLRSLPYMNQEIVPIIMIERFDYGSQG